MIICQGDYLHTRKGSRESMLQSAKQEGWWLSLHSLTPDMKVQDLEFALLGFSLALVHNSSLFQEYNSSE